jgi:pimeloyl-ACP methyl ester carboxylesterase
MTARPPLDLGQGPLVVLLHGVGVGPASFAHVAELLGDRHRVVCPERPVGPGGAALPVALQADRLVERLEALDAAGGLVVGVSGGATLGLSLAIRHPSCVGALVLHEPLVGPLAPELHQRFLLAATEAAEGDAQAMGVVRAVMGDTAWDALGPAGRAEARAAAPRWRGEVAQFAAFAPQVAELAGLRAIPSLVTVGGRSGPERWAAAEVLRQHAGAEVAVVPDAGNAVQLDAPVAFAHQITSWTAVPSGGAP